MAIYIDEFLYRGRAGDDARPPAWHVSLVAVGTDDFGRRVESRRMLGIDEAMAAGWDLPAVLAAVNAETLAELEALRGEVASLQTRLAAAEEGDGGASPAS